MAIQAFGVTIDPSTCRLFIDDDSDVAHVPRTCDFFSREAHHRSLSFSLSTLVYDHQPVDTINFKQNDTNLCLKAGQALKQNDLLLSIQSDREPNPLELIVDSNMTLTELWILIRQALHMDGRNRAVP